MSVQEPAWLKRTRPCPFFSQGRCLFADSCNFLHDVKVRNADLRPVSTSRHVRLPSPFKSAFDPPSVVVDSASPVACPDTLSSPVQDTSRYFGLLSVLSDVIGPPSTSEGASKVTSSVLPGPTGFPPEPDIDPISAVVHTDAEKGCSSDAVPFSVVGPDSEDALDDSFGYKTASSLPEEDNEFDAETMSLSDDVQAADGGIHSYMLEDNATESHNDDEDTNVHEDDFTMMVSNRQFTLSSFTGASLLASPRTSISGEPSMPSPMDGPGVDLLSPVELSAKLRPFPISSLEFKLKGQSIDANNTDGDSWVDPTPFPSSPPGGFQFPAPFLSHSRQASHPSPARELRRASHSPHRPIEEIRGSEPDPVSEPGSRDSEDETYTILDAYDTSPSEEQGEVETRSPPAEVNVVVVDEALQDEAPTAARSLRRYSPERVHLTAEHIPDLWNQSSFVSDDNLSFKTALSEQPSYEFLSDISKVSPVKQDSLLSFASGCSTPDTVPSQYSDVKDPLEDPNVGSHTLEPSCPNVEDQVNSLASEQPPPLDQVVIDSDVPCLSGALASNKRHSRSSSFVQSICGPKEVPPNANGIGPNVLYDSCMEYAVAQGNDLDSEDSVEFDEVAPSFDSDCDRFTQRLSFPLPPPFLPTGFIGQCAIPEEDTSSTSGADISISKEVSSSCMSPQEEIQQTHSDSDLTERVRPSRLPSVRSPRSDVDVALRRNRATSDLTEKRKSLASTPVGTWLLQPEQQERSDSVQSLYGQYSDSPAESSDHVRRDTKFSNTSNASEEPSNKAQLQSLDLSRIFQSPFGDTRSRDSGIDSPRSKTALRPFLTGRRSFLCSSLTDLLPKANHDSIREGPSARPSMRLQTREVGGTMVPLGFRRYKPQPTGPTRSPRAAWQPPYTVLPASQLREILRIRTDIAREDLPLECSSANLASVTTRSPLPAQSMSAPPSGGLKPLCLRSSILSTHSSSITSSILSLDRLSNSSTQQSPNVSSTTSLSRNSLLSPSCEQVPEQLHHSLRRSYSKSSFIPQAVENVFTASQLPSLRNDSRSVSAPIQRPRPWRLSHYRAGSRNYTSFDNTRRLSRASTTTLSCSVPEEQGLQEDDSTMSHPIQLNHAGDRARSSSVLVPPVHAIATPKPTLLFAIASDDVEQVRQVLESGDAGPNDSVGPQSALAFTLTNDKLAHKSEIVKALLAYGANPSALRNPALNPASRVQGANDQSAPPLETTLEGMDPATRYFIARADAAHTRQTSQLIYRSFFRPLTRVRYDVIGQDWALEQLFRVLSIHSQKLAVAPIVVLLCGPSGHGKSLLARKFGFLLDVPAHTVNVTTLRSAHDIWQSYSMNPYEEPSSCTLAEFLVENEGKRCVVVLDEIEKVEDQKVLWSLLMPWELGRCSLEAGKRHIDARNVIWLATSNVGHELVFEYHEKRAEPDKRMSREDYLELIGILRPCVSHCLGASLVSRVTTVLPFVPFTLDEKKAIAAEAVYAFAGDASRTLSPREVESVVTRAVPSYCPSEGARSLHRAISNILIDLI